MRVLEYVEKFINFDPKLSKTTFSLTQTLKTTMKKHYFLVLALAAMASVPAFGQVRAASEPVKLLESPVGLMAPVWSPDGSKIAVTTDNYTGILVADADGSNLRMLTGDAGTGYKMVWSADSRSINARAKVSENGRILNQLRTYTLADRSMRALGPKVRANAVAASVEATGIYSKMVSDPATAAAEIPALASFAGRTVINPALSPDGSTIAFQIPGRGMWTIAADGSNLRSLGQGSHPAWLPDSRTIVYTVVEDNGQNFTGSTLMSLDTATGARATVLSSRSFIPMTPAVSPDGTKVAFENAADAAIYTINIEN